MYGYMDVRMHKCNNVMVETKQTSNPKRWTTKRKLEKHLLSFTIVYQLQFQSKSNL